MLTQKFTTRLLIFMALMMVFSLPVVAQDDDSTTDSSYTIPDNPAGIDPSTVIARVGETEFTLEDFYARLRYERFRRLTVLGDFVTQNGPEVLILDDPQNTAAQGISQFLESIANSQLFANDVYRNLILEELYHTEAVERELEIDACEVDTNWTIVLNQPDLQTGECEFSEELNTLRQAYIDDAMLYSGMTEDEILATVTAFTEFNAVFEALGEEVELEPVETITTSHIRTFDEERAQEAMDALDAGGEWYDVLFEFTEDQGVRGRGGALGAIQPGQTVPEFDEALFNPENEVGDLLGPVETQFGFHVIEVEGINTGIRVRHILLEDESQAQAAVDILSDSDESFTELVNLYTLDQTTMPTGGDLGYLTEGNVRMPEAFNEAVFAAELNDIVGPIETDRGFHVAQVTEMSDAPVEVVARHILVEDEELAQELYDRLADGEDFALLADIYSLDGAGTAGDTWAVVTDGQQRGAYTLQSMFEQFPALALGLRDAEEGEIVGPLNTQFGFFIVRIDDTGTREQNEQERQVAIEDYVDEWQIEQLASDMVEETDLWRNYIVFDPMPSDISESLSELDIFMERSRAEFEEARIANSIPGILSRLTLPGIEVEPETTPEAEMTPDVEQTPEADEVPDDAEATEDAG